MKILSLYLWFQRIVITSYSIHYTKLYDVYDDFSSYYLQFDFLLYSCALSPSANIGAIAYNEQNDILIFDITTKSYLYNLTGQNATLTQILFIDENKLFASSDSEEINYFILGEKKWIFQV